jgi:AraC-like DNA-binding protein
MLLYIKNMVCQRCRSAVQSELEKAGLHPVTVNLGEVTIEESTLSSEKSDELSSALRSLGFELIDNRRSMLIEQIKTYIIELVHYKNERPSINLSSLLSDKLHHEYSYLSNLFSEVEGITIEQFLINHRIEKAKEMLMYDEMSLSQISLEMGYSSTAHLSAQFKKVTGLTASEFKKMADRNRKDLDQLSS